MFVRVEECSSNPPWKLETGLRGTEREKSHAPSIAASSISAKKPGAEPHNAVEASIA